MNPSPVKIFRPGDPGYTGTLASLAASSHAYVCIDLGNEWDRYDTVQILIYPVGPMGATNTFSVYGSDSKVAAAGDLLAARRLGVIGATAASQAVLTNLNPTNGGQALWVRPMGRFLAVDCFNQDASNAAGAASAVHFAAYPV